MNYSTIRRASSPALLVMAALAFTLPALGAPRPDDRQGLRGVGAASDPAQVRPDDRPGLRRIGVPAPANLRPDDRAGFRGISVTAPSPVLATDGGFDWAAAGAGAGSATALMLLLTGAALTLRRNHRQPDTLA